MSMNVERLPVDDTGVSERGLKFAGVAGFAEVEKTADGGPGDTRGLGL